eukprot:Colp12_sorted_trinity150504_noHs@23235
MSSISAFQGSLLSLNSRSDWIKLNIGGKIFETTRMTLSRDPNCFLAKLCCEESSIPALKDDNGAYLIDRDPHYFAPVLNFLRHGKLIMDDHVSAWGVLAEAEFYGVTELINKLKDMLERKRSDSSFGGAKTKHIYRVFESNEAELANMMSQLSDGWRLEQLVNVTPSTGVSTGSSQLYMVVSKEVSISPEER